jgi:hypothetical protein
MVRRRTSARKKRAAYAKLDSAAPARRSGALVILVLGVLVVVNLYVFVWDKKTSVSAIKQQALAGSNSPSMAVPSQPLALPSAGVPTANGSAIDGKVGKADTLGKLLKKSGLTAGETDEVIRALSSVLDFRTIKAGEAFRIERGADGRVARFDLEVSKNHHVRAIRAATGELAGSADPTR